MGRSGERKLDETVGPRQSPEAITLLQKSRIPLVVVLKPDDVELCMHSDPVRGCPARSVAVHCYRELLEATDMSTRLSRLSVRIREQINCHQPTYQSQAIELTMSGQRMSSLSRGSTSIS